MNTTPNTVARACFLHSGTMRDPAGPKIAPPRAAMTRAATRVGYSEAAADGRRPPSAGRARRSASLCALLGDPKQLRAIGVGGGFAAIHRQVDGLVLRHNRRQRDPLERRALEMFRAGQRRQANMYTGLPADVDSFLAQVRRGRSPDSQPL